MEKLSKRQIFSLVGMYLYCNLNNKRPHFMFVNKIMTVADTKAVRHCSRVGEEWMREDRGWAGWLTGERLAVKWLPRSKGVFRVVVVFSDARLVFIRILIAYVYKKSNSGWGLPAMPSHLIYKVRVGLKTHGRNCPRLAAWFARRVWGCLVAGRGGRSPGVGNLCFGQVRRGGLRRPRCLCPRR